LRRLIAFMRQWRPDFIHTHGYKECVLGSLAALLSGRVRCLRTVHGWMEWQPKFWQLHKRLIRMAELVSFRAQRGIVAVSAELGADMQFVSAGDGPLLDEVRQLTRELGLRDQVELPGFVADVAACLTNVDALIITSDHEGLPTVLLEAMALKVPVVAHAVGG